MCKALIFQSEKEFDARDRNRSHSHDPFQQRLVDFRCIFASGKDTDAMCDQEHRPACTGSGTDSTGYSTKYQLKRNALDCFFLCISRLVFPKQDGNSGEQSNEI